MDPIKRLKACIMHLHPLIDCILSWSIDERALHSWFQQALTYNPQCVPAVRQRLLLPLPPACLQHCLCIELLPPLDQSA